MPRGKVFFNLTRNSHVRPEGNLSKLRAVRFDTTASNNQDGTLFTGCVALQNLTCGQPITTQPLAQPITSHNFRNIKFSKI